ncbi:MAG: SGNH/GDSL hydrolase family protein [Verrucomicrobiaceae bacterium]|nr:SGNH/GDSL hydrolase family protein [Verrucomicrobiaceae bacterium]
MNPTTRSLATTLAVCATLALPAVAQEKKPAPAAKPPAPAPQVRKPVVPPKPPGLGLKDGDRFIFIGDSITHQCLYTQFVENFFFTRYPQTRIHFRNAGVSGDRAADALDRFDDDIASFKPTVATVLLGMNDGTYKNFDMPTFETYSKDMLKLMDRLDAIKCRVILMSPTMFDHQAWDAMIRQNPEKAKGRDVTNYNAVLAFYGKWAQEVARKRGYQFVDMYGPLNTFTIEERKTDPQFTLIPDAIHPAIDGQLVMAYSLLKQVGEGGGILGTGARLVDGQWKPSSPQVADISGQPGTTVSYTVKTKALPWVVADAAPIGARFTHAGHTLGQESHIVVGLKSGRYDLLLNGQKVGVFDERMLAVHAEIEDNKESPTHQQARKIFELNKKRNDEAIHPLRDLYSQRKGRLRNARAKNDMKEFEAWLPEMRAKEAELVKKAEAIEDEIYKANQPPVLKVEVKPAPPVPARKPAAKAAPAKKAA